MIEFGFFFSREPIDVIKQSFGQSEVPIGSFEMCDGQVVIVATRMTELSKESLAALCDLQVPRSVISNPAPRGIAQNLSAILMNETEPGIIFR